MPLDHRAEFTALMVLEVPANELESRKPPDLRTGRDAQIGPGSPGVRLIEVADGDGSPTLVPDICDGMSVVRAFDSMDATFVGKLPNDADRIPPALRFAVERHDLAAGRVAGQPDKVDDLVVGEQACRAHQHNMSGARCSGVTRKRQRLRDAGVRRHYADWQRTVGGRDHRLERLPPLGDGQRPDLAHQAIAEDTCKTECVAQGFLRRSSGPRFRVLRSAMRSHLNQRTST